MHQYLKFLNQAGVTQIIPLLLVVAASIGVGSFLLISSTAPFKGNLNTLYSKPTTEAATPTNTSFFMKVLVIKYFPVTPGEQYIDKNYTGDVGDLYTIIRERTVNITNNLVANLEKATSYLKFKNPEAEPGLHYQVVATKEYKTYVPFDPKTRRPLYAQILTQNNICEFVRNKNVSEVWLWAYQGPNYPGTSNPYLNISESKMSGPFGDISNSFRLNDLPKCGKTYRVYTFNYGRGTSEALESWGHQIEAEMDAVNSGFFRNIFQGPNYPQTLGVTGRCGSVHNPPNAKGEYDRANPIPQNSDCLDWNPEGLGTLSPISCQTWGCQDLNDNNNSSLNYMIWNWQNLPGRYNTKTYQGRPLRNLWEIHGKFDQLMDQNRTVWLPTDPPRPSPTPSSTPSSRPTDVPRSTPVSSPTPNIGLSVNVSAVDVTVAPGGNVYAFTITSTGANGFVVYGYPVPFGLGVNWSVASGGMAVGSKQDVYVQVNSNATPGVYTGSGQVGNVTDYVNKITFPVTVRVQ